MSYPEMQQGRIENRSNGAAHGELPPDQWVGVVPDHTAGWSESEKQLSFILDTIQAGVILVDEETHVICDVNQAAAKMIGRPAAEIVGRVCHNFICPAEQGRCPITDLGQKLDNSERALLAGCGTRVPILKTVVPVIAGNRPKLLETFIDVTEVKRAEESARDSQAKFRLLFEVNPLPMWVYDCETLRFLEVNEAAVALYGYSRDEFLKLCLTDIRPAEDIALLRQELARERQSLEQSGPWRHQLKDGHVIQVEILDHLLDWNGQAAALVVVRDTSDRRRFEESLRETEERFRTAFEHAPIGMCLTGLDGQYLQVNAALSHMLGYSAQDLLEKGVWQKLTYPADLEVSRRATEQFVQRRTNFVEFDKRYVHKSGRPIWCRLRISVVRDVNGAPSYFITHVEDISERKRAEEALRESQEKIQKSQEQYMLAVKGSNDGIWDWDLRNGAHFHSLQWKGMIGYEDGELANSASTFEEHLHPDDRARVLGHLDRYLKGEVPQYKIEFRFRHKDGSYLWILARGEALRDEHGVAYRMAGSHTDITDRKRAEELSRLSGMAEVAAGVLHNVGNVLNSVNVAATLIFARTRELRTDNLAGVIQMIQEHAGDLTHFLTEDPKGQRVLPYLVKLGEYFQQERQTMLTEVDRLREHVEHIKQVIATQQSYAKASGFTEEISLPALVEDAFRMIQPGFDRHHITIEREYENLPPVFCEKHSILEILLNLLRNAKDSVKVSSNPERLLRVRIRKHGEGRVRIEVEDSGLGLPPENLTRIFAYGFTTKPNGHGFGLHSGALAAQHIGGRLWAESQGLGRGATFILELPFAAEVKLPERIGS